MILDGLGDLCEFARHDPISPVTLVLGGSFFSDKLFPGDVEATLVYPLHLPPNRCWAILIAWQRIKDDLKRQGLDFYPTLPGANDFSAFFQYVGTKSAADKGLAVKDPRGVIEVRDW